MQISPLFHATMPAGRDMLSIILWWSGFALELAILARGLRARMLTRYPYFYIYMSCVLAATTTLYVVHRTSRAVYNELYWPTELVTVVAGCAVILEMVTLSLEGYPGAARFLRRLCLVVFAGLICYGCAKIALGSVDSAAGTERDIRALEAMVLSAMMGVVFYYGIRLGKNVKGLILGFGAYIGVSLMILALYVVFGSRLFNTLSFLQPGSYLFALVVWLVALWSYAPNPRPEGRGRGRADYDDLAFRTRERLRDISDQLKETARP